MLLYTQENYTIAFTMFKLITLLAVWFVTVA